MAREIYEWSRNAAANNFAIADGGMPEGMDRSDVNDSARERMRSVREQLDTGLGWRQIFRNEDGTMMTNAVLPLAATIPISTGSRDMTDLVPVGTRVRLESATEVAYGTVFTTNYLDPTLTLVLRSLTGDPFTTGATDVDIGVCVVPELGELAWQDNVSGNYIVPSGFTNTNVADAIALANASGGTVLLGIGTYDITTMHEIETGVTIMGQGPGSVLAINSGASMTECIQCKAGDDGFALRDFTISGQPAVGFMAGVRVEAGASGLSIDRLYMDDLAGVGINIDTDCHDISISNCEIGNIQGVGIRVADANTSVYGINIVGCRFYDYGLGITNGAGVKASGEVNISACHFSGLDLAGPAVQRGVWLLEQAAASPNQQDAHNCTVTGCTVTGSGANAIGVQVGGRNNSVSACSVELSGSVSRGIHFEGATGSRNPTKNSVTGCSLQGVNKGIEVGSVSDYNTITGCQINAVSVGVQVSGDNNYVSGCNISDGVDGVQLDGNFNVVTGVLLDDQTGDGAIVTGDNNFVTDLHGRSVTGDVIDVQAGAADNVLSGIHSISTVGGVITDAGDRTVADDVSGEVLITVHDSSNTDIQDASDVPFGNLTGVAFPGLGANAQRDYYFNLSFISLSGSGTFQQYKLHVGPNGDESDPVAKTISKSVEEYRGVIVTNPNVGETWTVSGRATSSSRVIFCTANVRVLEKS